METNEELNRWAHTWLGFCWHDIDVEGTPNGFKVWCKLCHDPEAPETENPAYTESLDLAAIVESKAIEMVGYRKYGAELYSLLTRGFRDNPDVIEEARLLVTAPALTRVQAAMRAVEGK